jgi:hypothetical protein
LRGNSEPWMPPGIPLVKGLHQLTREWAIQLPQPFARRVEDGSLVLWRPGITVWLAPWENDHGESQSARLATLRAGAPPHRFDEREGASGDLTRWSFFVRDVTPDGEVTALHAWLIADAGQLHMAVYFDDPAANVAALALCEAVRLV